MRENHGRARRSEVGDREPSAARGPASFARLGSLGVEEEFYVVDAAGKPVPAGEMLAETEAPPGLDEQLDTEMYRCIVETKTPVCDGLDDLRRRLRRIRSGLTDHAAAHGYGLAAAGLHPATRPEALEICSSGRYQQLLEKLRHPQYRNTTTGLHVHVGVDDADKAVWIANEIRWYLPVLLALSANSPFHGGVDTGLASARAHVFDELPNTAIPPRFDSYDDFAGFRETMLRTGSISDPGQLWWDVRPNDECGTVEIRAPDAQASLDAVMAFAEYARALVLDLAARYEDGDSPVDCRDAYLDQNRWRALRYGHDATFVDCDGDGVVGLAETVDRECHRLDVDGIARLLRRESGARRQRRRYREGGLAAVSESLRVRPPPASAARDTLRTSERSPDLDRSRDPRRRRAAGRRHNAGRLRNAGRGAQSEDDAMAADPPS